MADDFQEKTEDASSKKMHDARKKGHVAKSQDLTAGGLLLVSVCSLLFFGQYVCEGMMDLTRGVFLHLNDSYSDISSVGYLTQEGIIQVVKVSAPPLLGAFLAAFILNVIQVGWLISFEALDFKWNKINFFNIDNWKKFFSLQAVMKLIFGVSKLSVVGIVLFFYIRSISPKMSHLIWGTAQEISQFILVESLWMALIIALILIVLGTADWIYQHRRFSNEMKMSKQEVKDERKQTEGDALIKSRIRSMMHSMAQSRMKQSVPKADVVIANPVHYAIALKYDIEKMAAPVCLAKGMRRMALNIKDIAKEHGVAVVENPPLARGLYKSVDIGGRIPAEFYHPVAEVLAYVYSLNKKVKQPKGGRSPSSRQGKQTGMRP